MLYACHALEKVRIDIDFAGLLFSHAVRELFFPTARPWPFPPCKVPFGGSIFRLFNLDSSYVMTPIMLQGSHNWSGVRWGPRQGSWLQFLPKRCSMIITYVLVFQFLTKKYIYVYQCLDWNLVSPWIPIMLRNYITLCHPSVEWFGIRYFSLFQEVSSVSSGFNMFGWINSTNMMLIDLKKSGKHGFGW